MYFVARTASSQDITEEVRAQVAQMDPNLALFDAATMDERIAASLKIRRFVALVLNLFAAIALLLAGFGLYASAAHFVELRRREIGIRMALGAAWRDVLRVVARQSGAASAAGLLLGTGGALLAGGFVRNQLFGVSPRDPVALIAVIVVFAGVAVAAVWLPARRAIRIQPLEALREE
jgi:ABC-type antimicrobial peptide transport system permease subunit